MTSEPGVVVVGSASRDVAPDDPRGWRLGGAAAYAGLALARLGLRPRILLGLDREAAGAAELDLLRDAGASIRVVRLARGPVFDNREAGGVREQHCLEPGDPLPARSLPAAWRSVADWLFVPIADELPADWADVPAADARVALGWQGLLRALARGGTTGLRPPQPSPLLRRSDLVSVSRPDLHPGTRIEGLGSLLRPGAVLVVTDGEAGGSVWRIRGDRTSIADRYPAIPAARVLDPTGAGDVFLAGLVAARIGHPLAAAGCGDTDLRLAAAMGSLTVEAAGLEGVPSVEAIADRLQRTPGQA